MYHVTDSNMNRVVSNAYGALDGPMTRVQVKRLQSTLTSQISAIEASMSLAADQVNANGSICLFALNCSFGQLYLRILVQISCFYLKLILIFMYLGLGCYCFGFWTRLA